MSSFSGTTKFLCVTFLIICLWASQSVASRDLSEKSMSERHEKWMAQYGRVYKSAAEKALRFKIFKTNVEFIESFNAAGKHKYKVGTNKFADLTNKEFKASYTGFRPMKEIATKTKGSSFKYENVTDAPTSMDWRTKGCCWAFSAVAATEGINKLSTGKLISLSEQELVDCDTSSDQGCNGGLMDDAFKFIIKNKGLTTEANYPYKAADGTCNAKKKANHVAKITGFEDVTANSEAALLKAVANQPISVAIDAGDSAFQLYSSGVFTGECGTDLDHGVTAVGYGTTSDGTKYWLVKNSWGESWGESGYIRMERDVEADEGLCGIAMSASYPTAKSSGGREKKFGPFLDLCVSSLRRGHANLLCIVPILSDVSEETIATL